MTRSRRLLLHAAALVVLGAVQLLVPRAEARAQSSCPEVPQCDTICPDPGICEGCPGHYELNCYNTPQCGTAVIWACFPPV